MTEFVECIDEAIDPGAPASCPVCLGRRPLPFFSIDGRDYWRCDVCGARFLDPRHHPSRDDEYRHYLHHENDPGDSCYRRFLSKLADPLLERLSPGLSGLDYGCGPGPALAVMLRDAGHRMALFDPCFARVPEPFRQSYDFITCTEVVEHFHRPAMEFDRLDRMLRPGGWLAIMTCFQTEDQKFADWQYRRDPTHVVFYREETFRYIAQQRGWICEIPIKNVALMRKPPTIRRARDNSDDAAADSPFGKITVTFPSRTTV